MPAGQAAPGCSLQLFLQLSVLMLPSVLGDLSPQLDAAGASEDVSSRAPEDCDVGECSTQEHHETQDVSSRVRAEGDVSDYATREVHETPDGSSQEASAMQHGRGVAGKQGAGGKTKKACKCGSLSHSRVNHKDCPLNKRHARPK